MSARNNKRQLSSQEVTDPCVEPLQLWILELYGAALDTPLGDFSLWAAAMMQFGSTSVLSQKKSLLMAHVREATRLNARICPGPARYSPVRVGRALVGSRRELLHTTEDFLALIPRSSGALRDGVVPRAWLRNRTRRGIIAGVQLHTIRVGALWSLRAAQLNGCERLTVRERSIAHAFGDGKSYREVARDTGLTLAGVRNGLRRVYAKLGIRNKVQLAAMAPSLTCEYCVSSRSP